MQAAARLSDPIAHTSALTGLIAGAIVGAVLAVAIVGTGGGAAIVIGAALAGGAAGAGLGEYLGSLSFANQNSGNIARGSPDVFVNFKPQARADADIGICSKHGSTPPQIATGSGSVFINGFPAARVKDKLTCGSFILEGSPDVFIGGGQILCEGLTIDSEVPWQVHWLVIGAGVVGALLLGGAAAIPAIVGGFALGIPGSMLLGMVGRYYGDWLSENIGGEPEDWEKTGAFVGAAIGGWFGAKGGPKAWEFAKRIQVEPGSLGMNGGNIKLLPAPKEPTPPTPAEEAANLQGHGHARHGSHTTVAEQTTRAQTGMAPDGKMAPTTRATKFDTPEAELDAVSRATQRTEARVAAGQKSTAIEVDSNGRARLPRDKSVVTGHPGGYGSGVEVMRDPATGQPLPGRPVQPTGQDPNARVILQYNPTTSKWEPVTQFPTDEPVTP